MIENKDLSCFSEGKLRFTRWNLHGTIWLMAIGGCFVAVSDPLVAIRKDFLAISPNLMVIGAVLVAIHPNKKGIPLSYRGFLPLSSNFKMDWACCMCSDNTYWPACKRICAFTMSIISLAMSASRIRDSAAVKFSAVFTVAS